jgi:hypothetical protein
MCDDRGIWGQGMETGGGVCAKDSRCPCSMPGARDATRIWPFPAVIRQLGCWAQEPRSGNALAGGKSTEEEGATTSLSELLKLRSDLAAMAGWVSSRPPARCGGVSPRYNWLPSVSVGPAAVPFLP